VADDRRPSSPEVTTALEQLGRLSLRDLSMDELLKSISELSTSVMPGRPDTSVTVVVRSKAQTVASSGELATELDEKQYELDDGPCLHTARSGDVTEIHDTRTDPRWPDYARSAADHGCLSSFSVPLAIDDEAQVTGAMNVYAREPEAFDDASRGAALAFASYATVAAGNLHAFRGAQDVADNLRVALESRAVIDQAKGILMERHKFTADQAFQMLAQASMATNVKVRDVADHLVSTGEMPRSRPRRS
jgi:GAF domain-containing protein